MINPWILYSEIQPEEGEKVLCYRLITEDHDMFEWAKEGCTKYNGLYLSGPIVSKVQKEFLADGSHTQLYFWQPIDKLP